MNLFLKEKVEFQDGAIQPMHTYKNTVISRAGYQEYAESEFIPNGSTTKIVRINRTNKDVEASVKLLDNLPIIENHPKEDVKFSDKTEILGVVTNPYFKDGKIYADLVFYKTSKNKQLSLGYSSNLLFKDGEYYQTEIQPNHLATVPSARCGIICSLTKKNKKVENMKITFNDSTHEVTDEVGAYISVLQAEKDSKATAIAQAFKDGQNAQKDRELISDMANKRGVEFKDSDSIDDVKKAIVAKIGIDVVGKSMAFLDGIIASINALDREETHQSFTDDKYKEFDYSTLKMGEN